jgi:hypothetical protein
MIHDIQKPKISPQFTIDDIHKDQNRVAVLVRARDRAEIPEARRKGGLRNWSDSPVRPAGPDAPIAL